MSNQSVFESKGVAILIVFFGACLLASPALAQESTGLEAADDESAQTKLRDMQPFPNPSGYAATFSATGFIDRGGPFFQSLGTNGRRCDSCHQQSDGWTVV